MPGIGLHTYTETPEKVEKFKKNIDRQEYLSPEDKDRLSEFLGETVYPTDPEVNKDILAQGEDTWVNKLKNILKSNASSNSFLNKSDAETLLEKYHSKFRNYMKPLVVSPGQAKERREEIIKERDFDWKLPGLTAGIGLSGALHGTNFGLKQKTNKAEYKKLMKNSSKNQVRNALVMGGVGGLAGLAKALYSKYNPPDLTFVKEDLLDRYNQGGRAFMNALNNAIVDPSVETISLEE